MPKKQSFVKTVVHNIPNILSAIRLCLVPVFVLLYFSEEENGKIYAIVVYVSAVFTDILDGYIARHYNLTSNLGRIIDPLADKLMSLSVLTSITIAGIMPVWITVVIFTKELIMIAGGTFIHQKIRQEMPPSNIFGKAAAGALFVMCVSMMVFPNIKPAVVAVITVVTVVLAVCALISYIWTYVNIVNRKNKKI